MSEVAPIQPASIVPAIRKIGKKLKQDKRKKQDGSDANPGEPGQTEDRVSQHIDEVV